MGILFLHLNLLLGLLYCTQHVAVTELSTHLEATSKREMVPSCQVVFRFLFFLFFFFFSFFLSLSVLLLLLLLVASSFLWRVVSERKIVKLGIAFCLHWVSSDRRWIWNGRQLEDVIAVLNCSCNIWQKFFFAVVGSRMHGRILIITSFITSLFVELTSFLWLYLRCSLED